MNTGIFTGHIGRDAELRYTATNNDAVSNFSLGVNIGTKQKPETMWVDCQIWGKRAEALNPYLTKGTDVTAIGRVTLRQWTKNDGTPGATLQLAINEITLHGGKRGGDSGAGHDQHETPKPARAAPQRDEFEDDIPF